MSASGSEKAFDTSSKRVSMVAMSPAPSMTLPSTSFFSLRCGSCCRKPTFTPSAAQASPVKLSSWPAMTLSRVDLPAPLRPSTPILAPGRNDSQMSFNTCLPPGKVLFRPFIT